MRSDNVAVGIVTGVINLAPGTLGGFSAPNLCVSILCFGTVAYVVYKKQPKPEINDMSNTTIQTITEAVASELLSEHEAHPVELANGRAILAVAIALGGGIKFGRHEGRAAASVYSSVGAYAPVGYPPEGVYYGYAAGGLLAAAYEASVNGECEVRFNEVLHDDEMGFCAVPVGGSDLASRILSV